MAGVDVDGRVIIVTGAGRGIGRGIARYLGGNGARLAIGEYVPRRLERILAELSDLGVEAAGLACDVRNQADIAALVSHTVETFGRVDALVNNAMTFPVPKPFAEVTEADLDLAFSSGVKGSFWAMQAVYPHMKAAGGGRIVNVASSAGVAGFAGFAGYAAAKEAVRALTRSAGREWASDGVIVNCYCPASFDTTRPSSDNPFVQASHDRFWFQHPVGRVGDAEDDIGPVVLFLCSDACRYMTGETLMVDGGAFMSA